MTEYVIRYGDGFYSVGHMFTTNVHEATRYSARTDAEVKCANLPFGGSATVVALEDVLPKEAPVDATDLQRCVGAITTAKTKYQAHILSNVESARHILARRNISDADIEAAVKLLTDALASHDQMQGLNVALTLMASSRSTEK